MIRTIPRLIVPVLVRDGAGYLIRRVFPTAALPHLDPFLLLDDVAVLFAAGDPRTSPPHAWAGIEALTWMLEGTARHTRPVDGVAVIGPRTAEWVTAGAGHVHSESFDAGQVRSLRLWVGLPRVDRRVPASVQPVPEADIGTDTILGWLGNDPAGSVGIDLVAGRLFGARARVFPRTRITIARLRIPPNTAFVHSVSRVEPDPPAPLVPPVPTVALYTLSGTIFTGGPAAAAETAVPQHQLAVLAPPGAPGAGLDGDEIRIRSGAAAAEVLYLAGAALNEPVVRRGPFALRTAEDALQAGEEFRAGRFGTLAP